MTTRVAVRAVWTFVAVALPLSLGAEPPPSPESRFAKGDRLAEKQDYTGALLEYKLAYEAVLPKLRGLEFRNPVEPKFMERDELRAHMATLLQEEITPAEMRLLDATLEVFGFAPPGIETEEMLLAIYSEEVAGFYDPKRKQLFLIREKPQPEKKPGFFERLLGVSSEFDPAEAKATLSHEMAHALADQHFDLERLQEDARHDSDRLLALTALIEGEATLVMLADMGRSPGSDGREFLASPPWIMDATFRFAAALLPFAAGKAFRSAPAVVREALLFSYFKGLVFLLHLTNRDEWTSVDRAFRAPPLSTEQILHPEKFHGEVDTPQAITMPALAGVVAPDWTEIGRDVLGEFQISILLRLHWGALAAAGWDGDGYAVFAHRDGRSALAWYTTWDSEQDAREFAGAYARYASTRLERGDARPAAFDEPAPPAVAGRFRLERAGAISHLERRGQDVLVIEGFTESETDALLAAISVSEKHPKRHAR